MSLFRNRSFSFSPTWLIVVAFFIALLATGILIYQDYGLSWDETTQVELGIKNYRYVMKHDPALLEFRDRYYGPLFEMMLVIFQSRAASREMYLSRHLINFLAFFAGCLAFFGLGKYIYKKNWLALLGALFLVFSPRIFGHAFFNSKDIPFMVGYIFSLLSLFIFLDHPNWLTAAGHGLTTAALLAIRLPGLVIPALTLSGLLIEVVTRRQRWQRSAGFALLYLAVSLAALVLFWPALWPNPPVELLQAFRMMSNFPHLSGNLYLGQIVPSNAVPWHYIPVWIGVTTPILYLALFFAGLGIIFAGWLRSPRSLLQPQGRTEMILLGALFLPLLAVILLKSTLYDDWRQMFFIYPPLLLVALRGVDGLQKFLTGPLSQRANLPRWSTAAVLALLMVIGIASPARWMVKNHPYQNVYFNRLAGPDLRTAQSRFPLDYWGLAYREGLNYLLKKDPAGQIHLYSETVPGLRTAAIFSTQDGDRLKFAPDLSQATYFVGNYYNTSEAYPFKNEIYSVKVGDTKILSVFLLSEEEKR
jgi:hypothetical protein